MKAAFSFHPRSARGIPSVFWDHIMDWGDEPRKKIGSLMKARRDSGIPVDAPVNIQCADDTLYLAEIGSPPGLRVALGPRPAAQPDMRLGQTLGTPLVPVARNYWSNGPSGHGYRIWVRRSGAVQKYSSLNATPEATPLGSPRRRKEEIQLGPEMLTAETLKIMDVPQLQKLRERLQALLNATETALAHRKVNGR